MHAISSYPMNYFVPVGGRQTFEQGTVVRYFTPYVITAVSQLFKIGISFAFENENYSRLQIVSLL